MKTFLDIIMEAMTASQATEIFRDHGVDPSQMDRNSLKTMRGKLAMKLHPDRGGNEDDMKNVNAAYDVLVNGDAPPASAQQSNNNAQYTSKNLKEPPIDHNMGGQNNAFHDLRHVEAYFNNKAGVSGQEKPATAWNFKKAASAPASKKFTVHAFDGRFFRGMFTVPGTTDDWNEMADAMQVWDRFNRVSAVLIQDPSDPTNLHLVYAGGKYFGNRGAVVAFDSFNMNPSNDNRMSDRLRGVLDKTVPGWNSK